MKGEHSKTCVNDHPSCKCNTCKNDNRRERGWCCFENKQCPVGECPDYEPDDEEDGHA